MHFFFLFYVCMCRFGLFWLRRLSNHLFFSFFLLAHENLCDHFCSAGPESHTKVIQPSVLLRSCAGWEVGGGVGIQACWRALGDSSIITRHKRTSLPKSLYSTFIIFFVGRNTILFREKQVTEKMDANSHPSSLSLYGVAGSYALQKERKQVVCLLFSYFLFFRKMCSLFDCDRSVWELSVQSIFQSRQKILTFPVMHSPVVMWV